MHVLSVGRALPPHVYDQEAVTAMLARRWGAGEETRTALGRLHRHARVEKRHLALPLEEYATLGSFTAANDAFVRAALDLGEAAVRDALDRAGLGAADVDHLFFVSTTGVATPSIDARLTNRLGLRPDVRRTPIFGLGCAAGAVGVARAADWLKAYPEGVALLLSVELCSLTFQWRDTSVANRIATGLFGDGAAAVVLAGRERRRDGPAVIASRSIHYPGTEHLMGWRVSSEGFGIVLSADIPRLVRARLREDVEGFLAAEGLTRADIGAYVCHPGGPRVLEALEAALGLGPEALSVTWENLRRAGNLSSASVLMVLGDTLERHAPPPGALALMLAMGPGFATEMVLLRW